MKLKYDDRYWLTRYMLLAEGDDDGEAAGGGGGGGDDDGKPGTTSLLDLADKDGEADDGAKKTSDDAADKDGGKDKAGGDLLKLETRPDWLPEQFHDPKTGEIRLQGLTKSWKDQQDVIANRVKEMPEDALKNAGLMKIPEGAVSDPEAFELVVDDSLKDAAARVLVEDKELGEDPMLHKFRGVAAKHKLTGEAFNDIVGWYITESAAVMPAPLDSKAEMAKLGPQGQNVINATNAFGETLKRQGLIDDDTFQEYRLCCASAPGIKLIQAIRDHYGEKSVPVQIQQQAVDAAGSGELRAKQAAIGADLDAGKIDDREAQRRYEALQGEYKKFYGEEPAGASLVESS